MELIDPKKLIDEMSYDALMHDSVTGEHIYVQVVDVGDIEEAPVVDAIPRTVVDQIRWERDMAMGQLEKIGVGFCEKTDDVVRVVRCKDCWNATNRATISGVELQYCKVQHGWEREDAYCSHGKRKEVQDERSD